MSIRSILGLLLLPTMTTSVLAAECQLTFANEATLRLPVADTPAAQSQGLTGRADPAPGMLFVWARPSVQAVWMKNTPAPLDAAWIGPDGLIQSVQQLEPNTTTQHSSLRPAIAIIEVPRGQLESLGIERGSLVTASTCFNL